MKEKKLKINVKQELASMPSIGMSEAEFSEELRKTLKNISIRPTLEQSKILIFLDRRLHVPKAEAVKLCLDKALLMVFEDARKGLQEWDQAQVDGADRRLLRDGKVPVLRGQ